MVVTYKRQEAYLPLTSKQRKRSSFGYQTHQSFDGRASGLRTIGFLPALFVFLFLLGTELPYRELPALGSFVSIRLPRDGKALESLKIKALRAETGIPLPVDGGLGSRERLWKLESMEYRLQEEDRLSSLAQRYGLALDTLLSFNKITDARQIKGGSKIKIPETDGILYRTVEGDNLSGLLDKFGLSEKDLLAFNPGLLSFEEEQALPEGREVFIPGAALGKEEFRKCMGTLYVFPVRGRIVSSYGLSKDPFTQIEAFNDGIDIQCPEGSLVFAACDGRVSSAGYHRSYGNYVVIKHGQGYKSVYTHLDKITVKADSPVLQGDQIGTVGKSGYAPVPHLHFSLFKGRDSVDPMDYLN